MPSNLTISGGAFVTGKFGQALQIGGSQNSGAATSAAKIPASGDYSIAGWIRHPSTPGTIEIICSQEGAFWVGVDTGGRILAKYGANGSEETLQGSTVVTDGGFHFFVVRIGPSGGSLFVDGTQNATSVATDASRNADRTANAICIGRFANVGGYYLTGIVDSIEVYSGLLDPTPPTVARTGSEANLAYLWQLDGDGADTAGATATPGFAVAPNDPAIVYSPYNWTSPTTANAKTINAGAYFKTLFTGGACTIYFDVGAMAAPASQIYYRIDARGWVQATVASSIACTIPADTAGQQCHLLEVLVKSTTETANRWNVGAGTAVIFTGLGLASGAAVAAPAIRPSRVLIFGDSIVEGVRALNASAANDTDRNDAFAAWAYALGEAMGCEVGVVGFGAQGYTKGGSGNVPALPTACTLIMAGVARTFTPSPNVVLDFMGTNDNSATDSDVKTGTQAFINAMLTALGASWSGNLCVVQNLGDFKSAPRQAAVAAVNDPRVYYVQSGGAGVALFDNAYGGDGGYHPTSGNSRGRILPKLVEQLAPYAAPRRFNVTVS